MDTIVDRFLKTAFKYRQRPAFYFVDEKWNELSYGTFLSYVHGLASYLVGLGMEAGSRVVIVSENRFDWCAAYLGILMAGGIAVPIDANLGPAEIGNLIAHSGAAFLFHSEKTREKLAEDSKGISFDSLDFKKILNTSERGSYPLGTIQDVASIVYTSGTSDKPKGVILSHGNLCADADALINFGILSPDDNVLTPLPLHHTYPFMCTFLVPVFVGAKITFPPSLKGVDLMAAVREKKVTVFVAVPQLLELLRNRIIMGLKAKGPVTSFAMTGLLAACNTMRRKTGFNPGKLIFRRVHQTFGGQFRFFTSGGAKLSPKVMEELEGVGFTVLEGYGLTETSPVVTFNPPEKRKPGSAGKPLPSVELKILGLQEKEEGHIAVRGLMVTNGYYDDPQSTGEAFHEGWLLTGDLGYLDREGYLFITGRKKEVIVLRSGVNIFPEEVEKEYLKISLVKEIGILEIEGTGGAEGLFGVAVPDLDYAAKTRVGNIQEVLKEEIGRISAGLPSHMRLSGFTIHKGPLPRTPLGKLKRYMMKEFLIRTREGQEEPEEEKELVEDPAGRAISECLLALLDRKRTIRLSDHLELDLGLDSLKKVELSASLEDAFSLRLPEAFLSEVQTVRDIVSKIKLMNPRHGQEAQLHEWNEILAYVPSKEEEKAMALGRRGIEQSLLIFMAKFLRSLFKFFFKLEVKGVEKLPSSPFIIAPNHSSHIDGFVVLASVGSDILKGLYFLGYSSYFTGRIRSFFARVAHVIPVDPEVHLLKALRLSSYILRNAGSLCIFPEGQRSYDGMLMEFKKGISILARSHQVPVVPTRIEGTFRVLPRRAIFPKFRPIKIIFGQPVRAADFSDFQKGERDANRAFAEFLRKRVECLK